MLNKKRRSLRLMAIRSGEMQLTKNDLKNHIWLCTAVGRAWDTEELEQLEEQGFNYLFVSLQGRLIAYKLVRLR